MSKPNPKIDSSPTRHAAGPSTWPQAGAPAAAGTHGAGSASAGPEPQTQTPSQAQSHSQAQPYSAAQRSALAADFAATLQRGVHGLCFSPYLQGQQPGSRISEEQIRERLQILKPYTGWVRSFSCTDGHEQTPRVARELGLPEGDTSTLESGG